MALIFYLVLRAGLVSTQGGAADLSPFGVEAIGALVGMFSSEAAEKLRDVFETLLTKAPQGKDHTAPQLATISAITPTHGTPSSEVTITGTGLAGATAVSFGPAKAATVDVRSDGELGVVVPPGAQSGPITVTTHQGTTVGPTFTVDPSGS
jgi:hypothetical protein